ncbi:hypothetical protein CupriaWKF_31315 [Cupriavidus sp. WKF15]|uniref:hypothetical protein n=1 Tax=Cupriavidus sp. WKF15 TaxID=3032282 RepID=UPI0023E1E937|nr:hypothetical protein [Cupriavidus sp. WKF15]WER50838.1 hypothetical protein CupriaWKF_31315 [Cupriavidus sp. WKF15]
MLTPAAGGCAGSAWHCSQSSLGARRLLFKALISVFTAKPLPDGFVLPIVGPIFLAYSFAAPCRFDRLTEFLCRTESGKTRIDILVIGGGSEGVRAARLAAGHGERIIKTDFDKLEGADNYVGHSPNRRHGIY